MNVFFMIPLITSILSKVNKSNINWKANPFAICCGRLKIACKQKNNNNITSFCVFDFTMCDTCFQLFLRQSHMFYLSQRGPEHSMMKNDENVYKFNFRQTHLVAKLGFTY